MPWETKSFKHTSELSFLKFLSVCYQVNTTTNKFYHVVLNHDADVTTIPCTNKCLLSKDLKLQLRCKERPRLTDYPPYYKDDSVKFIWWIRFKLRCWSFLTMLQIFFTLSHSNVSIQLSILIQHNNTAYFKCSYTSIFPWNVVASFSKIAKIVFSLEIPL